MFEVKDELWLFVEHGPLHTWTRAIVPQGITTLKDMIRYLEHGGQIDSDWMVIPKRAKFIPRAVGMTVLAQLVEHPAMALLRSVK